MTHESPEADEPATLIYRHQLDDYTTTSQDECTCEEDGYAHEPTILTPRPDKSDTVELRCGECGAMWTDLYWSNMDDVSDEREGDKTQ